MQAVPGVAQVQQASFNQASRARSLRESNSSSVASRSVRFGVASSAAAVGVGARKSLTKSAIVKSVSWPTPLITGMAEPVIARATPSSLKAHKSSIEPPPARNEDHIWFNGFVEGFQGCYDARGSFIALNRSRSEDYMNYGIAAPDGIEHISQGSAGR